MPLDSQSLSRNSRPEVFCEKVVLRNFAKFTGKHLCPSFFFIKVAGATCNFIKKKTLAQVFSCEFCEISKNTSGGCFCIWKIYEIFRTAFTKNTREWWRLQLVVTGKYFDQNIFFKKYNISFDFSHLCFDIQWHMFPGQKQRFPDVLQNRCS